MKDCIGFARPGFASSGTTEDYTCACEKMAAASLTSGGINAGSRTELLLSKAEPIRDNTWSNCVQGREKW